MDMSVGGYQREKSQRRIFRWNVRTKHNRHDLKCPDCGAPNSTEQGGNERCFHCGNCGWTECVAVFAPECPDEDKMTGEAFAEWWASLSIK